MAAYYEISYATGFAWMQSYVVKVDYATTDFGALTDILIDWLVENDKRNILDMENEYEWDGDNIRERKDHDHIYHSDEFIVGGNCGNVLIHYGGFYIREIKEDEIGDAEVIEG